MTTKPMLLLDVDGPLNPWPMHPTKAAEAGYTKHRITTSQGPFPVYLNPAHGDALNALTDVVDLVWATSWEHEANTLIAPLLGLPTSLPVITWPDGAMEVYSRGSWKTKHVATWTAGRAFAWFDDEVNRYDRNYLAATNGIGPHLLVRVEEHHGLKPEHFDRVRGWATTLT